MFLGVRWGSTTQPGANEESLRLAIGAKENFAEPFRRYCALRECGGFGGVLYPALFDFMRRKEGDTAKRNLPLMGGRVCFDQDGTDLFSGKESAPVSEADWRGMCGSRCRDKGARIEVQNQARTFHFQTDNLCTENRCVIRESGCRGAL